MSRLLFILSWTLLTVSCPARTDWYTQLGYYIAGTYTVNVCKGIKDPEDTAIHELAHLFQFMYLRTPVTVEQSEKYARDFATCWKYKKCQQWLKDFIIKTVKWY